MEKIEYKGYDINVTKDGFEVSIPCPPFGSITEILDSEQEAKDFIGRNLD